MKGIINFGIGLTLREGNREYFYERLDKKFPGLKEVYKSRYGFSCKVRSSGNNELYPLIKTMPENNIKLGA